MAVAPLKFKYRKAPLPAVRGRTYNAGHLLSPPGKGPNGRPFCCWCHEEVSPRRSRWCSEACHTEFYANIYGVELRKTIFCRDEERCVICKFPLGKFQRIIRTAEEHYWDYHKTYSANLEKEFYKICAETNFQRHLWECDHILPLSEGGLTHPENLRTLCIPCHKKFTAEGVSRRAKPQRAAKQHGQQDLPTLGGGCDGREKTARA